MITTSAHTEARDRLLTVAVWLIGLGALFLVKDSFGWSWPQAWPLWIIYLGIGTAGSAIFTAQRSPWGIWGIWWPIAVIAIGVVLLLSTTGNLAYTPTELIAWWPLAVIALGAWFLVGAVLVRPKAPSDKLAIPLGMLASALVKINFGGGELVIGPAEPGTLVSGHFEGGAIARTRGPGHVEIEPHGGWPFMLAAPLRWQVGLTDAIPVSLRLDSGANRGTIDLSALNVRDLELHTGMSETRVRLPSRGVTSLRAEAGMASLTIEVPQGVAARIHSKMGLGSTTVDETRFPRGSNGWQSADYDTATDRVDIDISGGLGAIHIN